MQKPSPKAEEELWADRVDHRPPASNSITFEGVMALILQDIKSSFEERVPISKK